MRSGMQPQRILVEAGAGCGKTYGLVSAYLSALGVKSSEKGLPPKGGFLPSQVVVLTFTEDAAAEMLRRISERLEELALPELREEVLQNGHISTFHSYCFKLISGELQRLGYPTHLAPSHLSRAERGRYLLKKLSEDPQLSEYLKVQRLRNLVKQGLDLWFADPQRSLASLHQQRKNLNEAYAHWHENFKTRIDTAFHTLSQEELQNTWLKSLHEGLEKGDLAAQIKVKFTGGKHTAKNTFPELYHEARHYRSALINDFHLSLSNLDNELNYQTKLINFYTELHKTGPKILDFEAMEKELYFLLKQDESPLPFRPPSLFIVDEFQDTSPVQFEILEKLSAPETQWYFVGDPKQSIYFFRGADSKLFQTLKKSLDLQVLDRNWRSHPRLLEFFNLIQNHLFFDPECDPDPQVLTPSPQTIQAPLDVQWPHLRIQSQFETPEQIFQSMVDDFNLARKLKPGLTHAALFPTWKKLFEFTHFLRSKGLSFQLSAAPQILQHHLSFLFFTFVEALVLKKFEWLEALEKLWQMAPVNTDSLEQSDILQLFQVFVMKISPTRWNDGALWVAYMERFLNGHSESSFVRELDPFQFLSLMQEQIKDSEVKIPQLEAPKTFQPDTFILMTAHGSKGLEFDTVYYSDLDSKRSSDPSGEHGAHGAARLNFIRDNKRVSSLLFEHKKRHYDNAVQAEKSRVAYVALTRAKTFLNLYLGKEKIENAFKEDPLLLFGLPPRRSFSLTQTVFKFFHSQEGKTFLKGPGVEWQEHIPSEEPPATDESPESTPLLENWRLPGPPAISSSTLSIQPFHRMGVSSYLDQIDSSPLPNAEPQRNSNSNLLGERLHRMLELWNGDTEHLPQLCQELELPKRAIEIGLELRKHPLLSKFWRDQVEAPEKVLKEFGLYIHSANYRLSGFADVVWFPSPKELWIIDWKSTLSPQSFSEKRKEKIGRQLELYAEAFQGVAETLKLLAFQLNLNEQAETTVELAFEKTKNLEPSRIDC